MHKFLLLPILLVTAIARAEDTNLDGQPQDGEHLTQCKTRNQNMDNAIRKLNGFEQRAGPAAKECFEQIRASAEKCSQDPTVGSQDMQDAGDIGSSMQDNDTNEASNAGGTPQKLNSASISNQFYATAGVHKMKESKYRSRASSCRNEAKSIESACQKSLDALNSNQGEGNGEENNNEQASVPNSPYAALDFNHNDKEKAKLFIQTAARDSIKAIKTAAYCDLISGNDENSEAQQSQIYAKSLSTAPAQNTDDPNYHKPLVPQAPNPTQFADGTETKDAEDKTKTRVEKITGSKTAADLASFTVNTLGDTGTVAGSLGRTVYNVADSNYVEAAKSGAATVVQSAPYAAEYMGWSSARTWLSSAAGVSAGTAGAVALALPGAYFSSTTSVSTTQSLTGSGYVPLDLNSGNSSPQVAINLMDPKQSD